MNLAIITGRTTRAFETYTSKSGTTIAKSTVAVDSGFGDKKRTDFINITTFGKTAEFCADYVEKGDLVEVNGHIVTGSYKKSDGTTVFTTDVNVDAIKKLAGKKQESKAEEPYASMPETPFEQIESDIPF